MNDLDRITQAARDNAGLMGEIPEDEAGAFERDLFKFIAFVAVAGTVIAIAVAAMV